MTAEVPYDTMSNNSVSRESTPLKCCFCVPLRLGCFVLGYLTLVLNIWHTLSLLTITTYIGIVTHGFDHIDTDHQSTYSPNANQIGLKSDAMPVLSQIGFLLIMVLCVNFIWLMINVAVLVGVHKKRPGPIRVYVGLASIRLLLSLVSFIFLSATAYLGAQNVLSQSIELGIAAYFIFVYYTYAVQLENERAAVEIPEVKVNDITFIYPAKIDKEHLVAKY